MREFNTGATRDTDKSKLDFEGFLSPLALQRYAEYMNKHRMQADGNLRNSDNWQKGIPKDVYMKSGFRHFFDWWVNHRGIDRLAKDTIEESLCGLIFNAMGYLHEHLKQLEPIIQKEIDWSVIYGHGPSGAISGRVTSDEHNAVEIDGPYVPQPGDVVFINLREDCGYNGLLDAVNDHYNVGAIVKKDDTVPNLHLYLTKIGTGEFNLYPDELTLLKRKDS